MGFGKVGKVEEHNMCPTRAIAGCRLLLLSYYILLEWLPSTLHTGQTDTSIIGSYRGRTLQHELYFKSTGTDRDIFYWKLQGTEHQSNYYFSFKSTRTDRNINYRIGSYRGWNITHQTDIIFDWNIYLLNTTDPGQTDTLMEVYKFRSVLTEVTGDGTYICITMC